MTKIIEGLISTLDLDAEVLDVRVGLFHTAVLTRNCGLAATLPRDALKQEPPVVAEPGRLAEKSAQQLARMAFSNSIVEAAVGIATINSLLDIDERSCQEVNARELIAEKGRDKDIAIIGHFPFVPYLGTVARSLWVIDKNPHDGDLPEHEVEVRLPQADVLAITGTSFTNHTIEHLLELRKKDAFVVILGDSAPLSPVVFEYGIDAVSGTRVVDPDATLRSVSQGANYRQIKGIRQLTMLKDH